MLNQLKEISLFLKSMDNGADAALIQQAIDRLQQSELIIQNLKACVLSMSPTDFTNDEFCQQTLRATYQFLQGENYGETSTTEYFYVGTHGSQC